MEIINIRTLVFRPFLNEQTLKYRRSKMGL